MNLSSTEQTLQLIAWFLSLIELILGLSILILDSRHSTNQHTSLLFLLFSGIAFTTGWFFSADTTSQAALPAQILAIAIPLVQPALLITTFSLIKPEWVTGRNSFVRWVFYVLLPIAALVTFVDVRYAASIWYSGIPGQAYSGGFIPFSYYTQGRLDEIIRLLCFYLPALLVLLVTLYVRFRDRKSAPAVRKVAGFLLAAQVAASVFQLSANRLLLEPATTLVALALLTLGYGNACYQQMVSERRLLNGKLITRMNLLALVITLPTLGAMAFYAINQASAPMTRDAKEKLESANQDVSKTVDQWLEYNVASLQQLAAQPEIASMDAAQQKPALTSAARIYPHQYLIATVDMSGWNVARSDDQPMENYTGESWFQRAAGGEPVAMEPRVDRLTGHLSLILATPVRNPSGEIRGVAMFAVDAEELANTLQAGPVGARGYSYVVDSQNRLVSHADHRLLTEVRDWSAMPAVQAVRGGVVGQSTFIDSKGLQWIAATTVLENGWAVVVQMPGEDLFAPVTRFRMLALVVLAASSILLVVMFWMTFRQNLAPIATLSKAAAAVSTGTTGEMVLVESNDETGVLAQTFNRFSRQLGELLTSLDYQVAERTRSLERQAGQLQVTAEVAREAASIRDMDTLLDNTVHLITDRFGYYHTGIFLIDEAGQFAVLRAASSSGGKRMLARAHRLKVGEIGIVGFVAAQKEARIARDVSSEPVFFNNPDLPDTRSEAAFPLVAHGNVIGVLDVQSIEASAFKSEDMETLQVLADQVALAIDNARLLAERAEALKELEQLYMQHARSSWSSHLGGKPLAFAYDSQGVKPAVDGIGLHNSIDRENGYILEVPIQMHNQRLGSLLLRRAADSGPWLPAERQIVEQAVAQAALALDNARLLVEVQRMATREQQINMISNEVRRSVSVESILQNTVRELGKTFGATRTFIQINTLDLPPATQEAASKENGNGRHG